MKEERLRDGQTNVGDHKNEKRDIHYCKERSQNEPKKEEKKYY